MRQLSRWLHAPGSLLVLFGTVVALPAAPLVFLGVQLLEQDRALAVQRRSTASRQTCSPGARGWHMGRDRRGTARSGAP
jgi:hypothetical protein